MENAIWRDWPARFAMVRFHGRGTNVLSTHDVNFFRPYNSIFSFPGTWKYKKGNIQSQVLEADEELLV